MDRQSYPPASKFSLPAGMGPAGMLLFDKPENWTSHDAAEAFRRILPKGTKVGHCGTLDPLATGLLILLVGPCTRLQEKLQGFDKVYSGKIRLGLLTDTGDITGKTMEQKPVPQLTLEGLKALLNKHVGVLEMPAPAYSAVKHQGKPLYKYARQGIAVPAKPRKSTVFEWEALAWDSPDLEHRLRCSSGTYVRSLAEVIGKAVGCGGTVATLRRERIAAFDVKDALTLERMKTLSSKDLLDRLTASLPLLQAAVLPK